MKIASYIGQAFALRGTGQARVGEIIELTGEPWGDGWRKLKGRVDSVSEDGTATGVIVEDLYIEDAQA